MSGCAVIPGAIRHGITRADLNGSNARCSLRGGPRACFDGVTWQAYGENLEEKLKELHDRVHRGSYRARPARRTYIPKADGSKRPLSILCLVDKIVQQAVATVLEAIYEEDFVGFSYGFRPGRSAHQAVAQAQSYVAEGYCYVVDIDLENSSIR